MIRFFEGQQIGGVAGEILSKALVLSVPSSIRYLLILATGKIGTVTYTGRAVFNSRIVSYFPQYYILIVLLHR